MEKYALYHPASGKYLSNYFYDSKNKSYSFHVSNDIQDIWTWNEKSHAERQLNLLFNRHHCQPNFVIIILDFCVNHWSIVEDLNV